jgi:hypothetical protein
MAPTKKKALLVYYTQSGQLKRILDSVCEPLSDEFDFVSAELKPVPAYPFPWPGIDFFQAFPESVMGIPCTLEPLAVNPDENFDLVILAYQSWYLSPSIPVTSFLKSEASAVLNGKPVMTIIGCRNMWIMAQEKVKKHILRAGGRLVGNIVLTDRHHNLVSVITIMRWLIKGRKQGTGFWGRIFPEAGVSEKDIIEAGRFAAPIREAFQSNRLDTLQEALLDRGAVKVSPVLLTIEKRGLMMFRIWAKFVLRKGPAGDPKRNCRLKWFRAYLIAVIYLVSAPAGIIAWLVHRINARKTRETVYRYARNELVTKK